VIKDDQRKKKPKPVDPITDPCSRCSGTGRVLHVSSWECEVCGGPVKPEGAYRHGAEPGRVRHVKSSPACHA